jgi:hypothetical protein
MIRAPRFARRLLAAASLLSVAGPAAADPGTLVALGSSLMASTTTGFAAAAWLVGGMIVSSALTRAEQRSANRAAKAKAVSELQARTMTALSADPPWRVIYGEATTGGDIHAIITHDKTNGQREDGSTYTRPDAYKSLVIVWADHQCKGVKTILINGLDIGAVDAQGWVTGGAFATISKEPKRTSFTGTSVTLSEAIVDVLTLTEVVNGQHKMMTGWTLSTDRKTLTRPALSSGASPTVWLSYTVAKAIARVRVEHFRGTSSQAASAYLQSVAPAQWTADHRLRGKCYSIVTLDLEDTRFLGGYGEIMAVVEGHDQILDPRTSTTGYSVNPALCINNWLLSPWGYGDEVTSGDVHQARLIAAANACDVSTNYTEGTVTTTGPRYTCNGAFKTDAARESVLEDLRESMAGHVAFDGQWLIDAGAWSAPVLTINEADLAGPIELVQAGAPSGELYNGIRSQYLPPAATAPADADPYSNATLVTADGKGLWGGIALPYTNSKARCKQISRVIVERSRDGQIIRIPVKRKALRVQVGGRIEVNNTEYGFAAKTFRVTDQGITPHGPQHLVAQEDAAAVYDTVDATTADPNPNTGLLSPLIVPAMGAITVTSGTAELLILQDGTIVPRVQVAWAAVTDPYTITGGYVETRWRNADSLVWADWRQAPGESLSVYLDGMSERTPIIVEARLRNSLGYVGTSAFAGHVVLGKSAAPTNVAGLIATVSGGQALIAMDPCPDADYAETEVRVGNTSSTWATATRLGIGNQNVFAWMPYPAAGQYNVFAVHRDSSGNESTPQAIVVTVTAAGISSAASGTNLVMNGDFWAASLVDPLHPASYVSYYVGYPVPGNYQYERRPGRDGTGFCLAMTASVAVAAGSANGRFGFVTTSNMVDGLVTGGVSGGWRPGTTYTVSYWARAVRGGTTTTESDVTHVATTSGNGSMGSGGTTITNPAGLAVGDLLVAAVTYDQYPSGVTLAISGWTRIGTQQGQTAPNGRTTTAFYKVATATETAAASFALTASGSGSTEVEAWVCTAYRGVDTATPIATTGAWASTTAAAATAPTAPSIATSGNTGIVWIGATDPQPSAASTVTAPGGYTLRGSATTTNGAIGLADKLPKAANGTVAALAGGTTGSTTFGYDAVMIALKPASTSGGSGEVATEWENIAATDLYWNTAPASQVNESAIQTVSYQWRQFRHKITWGSSVDGAGSLYVAMRGASAGATPLPAVAAGHRLEFDDLMVSLGSEYPVYERSPQDDIRPASIGTLAMAPNAAADVAGATSALVNISASAATAEVPVGSITFTPDIACTGLVTVNVDFNVVSGGWMSADIASVTARVEVTQNAVTLAGKTQDQGVVAAAGGGWSGTRVRTVLPFELTAAMAAGQVVTVNVYANRVAATSDATAHAVIRRELIKR